MGTKPQYNSLIKRSGSPGGSPIKTGSVEKPTRTYNRSRKTKLLKSLNVHANTKIGKYHEGTTEKEPEPEPKPEVTNSSILSFIPDGFNDSDSDDDLIDIGEVKVQSKTPDVDFKTTEKLVANGNKRINTSSVTENTSEDINSSNLISNILEKDNLAEIKNKYKGKEPPKVPSKPELLNRIDPLLDRIPDLLSGKENMSFFYDLAKEERNKTSNETLRQRDKYHINWQNFAGGYYGLQRQQFIASIIMEKYQPQLKQSLKKNATVQFWGIEDFSKYVLSNEIILRLIVEDKNCTFAEAEVIIRETSDYAAVTDSTEFS
ncbi:putative restriction of telomere capping protein 4 [[Candida] jaroonii]|uniref:Restriction of telomere capping protein 4 n=1 Tax=[Candida] jaroonii TaxID=467808 RepID=A0ACA9Y5U9_9ASCO|nr:putative restriction of telomere capping protein 4 [[Candida] jaroonii]